MRKNDLPAVNVRKVEKFILDPDPISPKSNQLIHAPSPTAAKTFLNIIIFTTHC